MVIAPASEATRQAIITGDEVITKLLNPAASASGIVSPSTSPMHMFLMKLFFFNYYLFTEILDAAFDDVDSFQHLLLINY